ncbi:HAD-IA family hydrolase [candidate division WWE3 bacterium]|uniref:HAD-IA family hydrolase n=1 Tax=candidate division WWE3 bacterium TaxID=2053526 RepID=A0A955RRV6_UNCKA|nr:HAD-IA family hydrolase [candidate division WWE3 bacterium]
MRYNQAMDIEFIYFDVGGVVVLDMSKNNKFDQMLAEMGLTEEMKQKFSDYFIDKVETDICRGEKTVDSLIPQMRNVYGANLPDDYSFLEDFTSRFEANTKLQEIMINLKKRYPIGLLTNMYPGMLQSISRRGLLPEIDWDAVIDSSIVHHNKPEPEIYELAETLAKTKPERILFVENSQMHIDGAAKRSWQTLLYDPANVDGANKRLIDLVA